ncbi:MAG: hypothetical protein BucCj_1210 [Buchnera aphidicola (Ceratovacuna japonica)]
MKKITLKFLLLIKFIKFNDIVIKLIFFPIGIKIVELNTDTPIVLNHLIKYYKIKIYFIRLKVSSAITISSLVEITIIGKVFFLFIKLKSLHSF